MKNRKRILLISIVLTLSVLACITSFELPRVTIDVPEIEATQSETATKEPAEIHAPEPTLSSSGSNPINADQLLSQQDALIEIYDNVSPGVVAILVATDTGVGSGFRFCGR